MTRMNADAEAMAGAARNVGRRMLAETRDPRRAWDRLAAMLAQHHSSAQLADALAAAALGAVMAPARPEVVVLCGSTRFRDAFHEANRRLTLAGAIVLAPGVFGHADGVQPTEEQKTALDALHLRKIDLADRVFVVNPGGYIGESTRNEIAYAERTGKPVDYLHGEDFTTAGPPHPVAAARARAAAEQLPTVGQWPGSEQPTAEQGHRVNIPPIPAGPDRHA